MMTITILGSGTGVPWRTRASPGWVLQPEGPDSHSVLVDPSAGSIQRMAERGIPLESLTDVLFTHYHPDHCGDLIPLLFALRNPRYGERPGSLRLIGPRGLRGLLRGFTEIFGSWIEADGRVQVLELGGQKKDRFVTIGSLEVTAYPVAHCDSSVAYRFLSRGRATFAYTGDTDRCPGVVDAARNTDLLLIECSFPEHEKRQGHLIPSEVGRIASAAGTRRVVLLHIYPECYGHDLLGPCREYYSGHVQVGEDGMVLHL